MDRGPIRANNRKPGGSHLPLPGTTTGKESWAGADVTADSLAARRAGMKLLDKRSLSEFKMGDDGDRLINGREAAVNQGGEIETLAPDLEQIQGEEMSNTDKQLAELVAEEKKLLEQQKNEREALKKRLSGIKKQIR